MTSRAEHRGLVICVNELFFKAFLLRSMDDNARRRRRRRRRCRGSSGERIADDKKKGQLTPIEESDDAPCNKSGGED